MTAVVISQPMLFPWPGFFEQLMLADVYIYLDDAQFSKGSFTNRIQMKYGNDIRWMTIPLAGKGSFTKIADLRAADDSWKASHRALLRQSLQAAPYLNDALVIFDLVYSRPSLCDLLIASIEEPARYLGIGAKRKTAIASEMAVEGRSWQRVLDMVKHFGGTRYVTGHGALSYLDHEAFQVSGVAVDYMDYSRTPWPQNGETFTPYVSILDLIAHMGPRAAQCLVPATTPWQALLKQETVTS